MAAAHKIITVDLGANTLKFAEFAIGRGGALTLLHFGVAGLGLDPNKEEERAKFITPTLTKLFKEHKIKGGEVLLSISGQSVFMRFVKLPPVEAAQIEQVVRFEAQQNVPFPLEQVTWDYQMMPTRGSGTDAEAVIVAIKNEVIQAEVEAVERVGVKVKQVDVAPFALLNAFRYSEPQTDECVLIIDMGARSTNLVFVEKSTFWIRNVPIAGNQISQNICNEMQEPFMAAETLKKGKGFVSLGGVYADPDDADAARISKLIRSTMTRLHVDINRSIAYYRTTLSGAPPKRVFLTGGSSQLPYLDLFIADKLNLPVAYFNPLRNVSLDPAIPMTHLQQNSCYVAELTGLALRETGSCPAEVTLDAPTLAARSDKRRKLPYYAYAFAAWVLLFVCLGLYEYQQVVAANAMAQKLSDNTQGLHALAPKITELAKKQDALDQMKDDAVTLGDQRETWAQILVALNEKIPSGVWITKLTPVANPRSSANRQGGKAETSSVDGFDESTDEIDELVINGLYHSNPMTQVVSSDRLRDFVHALADLPYFDIDKNNITATLPEFGGALNAFAQKFTLHLKLKTPIRLKPDAGKP
ncbi:MAG TPA: type IV pilus assembly protein PilM [Candidatus Methylacidiphilales bacterium]|jgi:type IV pilus assembly protein PilM|nr:type IV pilus assembly protein PilM [Candidatus Methylacidiphilales bacterium]